MTFYRISDNSFGTGGKSYPWAYGYGPLESGMPFLHPLVLEMKQKAWELSSRPEGIELSNKGIKWPDVLGCGGGPPREFYSKRVIEGLERIGAPPYRVTHMPIGQIVEGKQGKQISQMPRPEYYVIETSPGIEVAWHKMGVPTDEANNAIMKPRPKPWPPKKWKVLETSWNGQDLFTWKNFKTTDRTDLLCTEKVKELAEEEGWTNIAFQPLETI